MPSPVVSATLQAAMLSGMSNILAQMISAYQSRTSFTLETIPLIQFVTFSLISTPPNFYWQALLEENFPSSTKDAQGQNRLSKRNTVKKFILDQTIAGSLNTVALIAGMGALRGKNSAQISKSVEQDFWPLMQSGLKVWPLVSLLSFAVIPANQRILFGSVVGLFWGIYLSLLAAQ